MKRTQYLEARPPSLLPVLEPEPATHPEQREEAKQRASQILPLAQPDIRLDMIAVCFNTPIRNRMVIRARNSMQVGTLHLRTAESSDFSAIHAAPELGKL